MGLKHAYVIANFFCNAQQFVCGVDISGYAEVGALPGDQAEKVGS